MNNFFDNKLVDNQKILKDQVNKSFLTKIGFKFICKHLPRTLLALSFTLFFSAFMTAMQAVTDNRAIAAGLHKQAEDPLPDLIMDWTGTSGAKFIPMYMADLFLNSLIAFTIACFIFSWQWRIQRYGLEEGHYRTFRLARKFLWMLGFAYVFRSFSLLSTTMPPTDPRCVYKQRNWKQIPFMAIEIMTKQGNTCSDKIFSGHSSMATLICLFWLGALLRPERSFQNSSENAPVPLWRKFAASAIVLWTSLVYIFCVLCRNHYSIDIIVAIFVCSGIFSTFQLSLKIIELGQFKEIKLQEQSFTKFENMNENAVNLPTTILALPAWSQQHLYSPLKNDPEVALNSPQIHMTEIKQLEDDFKPPSRSLDSLKDTSNNTNSTYVPRLFVYLLRSIAWMDGIDLKP